MPGTVIRYLVKEGERVEAGAAVVVVEAMKMENRLTAPRAGTVRDIRYQPGDRVARGAALLCIG
jgi:3-methylcrotonyl-CoA carboxylase alpha subunit